MPHEELVEALPSGCIVRKSGADERIGCDEATTLGHTPDSMFALLPNLGGDIGAPTLGTESMVTRERGKRRLRVVITNWAHEGLWLRSWGCAGAVRGGPRDREAWSNIPGVCRMGRRGAPDRAIDEVPWERSGPGAEQEGGVLGAGDIPAATETAEALSMYFSIRRSLFQLM